MFRQEIIPSIAFEIMLNYYAALDRLTYLYSLGSYLRYFIQ
jgi:hypothetical protein